ncbi:MAG TPA: hypothetical protein DD465_22155, partial [Thalassospira sp.]|nr:hypothetical protein [Thalassospira sp.]
MLTIPWLHLRNAAEGARLRRTGFHKDCDGSHVKRTGSTGGCDKKRQIASGERQQKTPQGCSPDGVIVVLMI